MADDIVSTFLARFPTDSLVLDSNLLLVLIATQLGESEFQSFRRCRGFSFRDGVLLSQVAARYRALVTTSAILAETSNLAGYAPDVTVVAFRRLLKQWIGGARDTALPAVMIVEHETYWRLGFTDATLALLGDAHANVVMTADVPLYLELESLSVRCLNFNHLRAAILPN